jgi:hypothetical protein
MKGGLVMKKIFFLVFALILMSWSQASADYSFSYKGGSIDISGMLYTPSNGDGPLQVTGGYFGAGAATLLPVVTTGRNTSPGNAFYYDNLLYPNLVPMLTGDGLLFTKGIYNQAGYTEINIWGNTTATNYTYYEYSGGAYTITEDGAGTFAVQPVPTPIPAAVWLLGTGLVGLVGIRRRFRN